MRYTPRPRLSRVESNYLIRRQTRADAQTAAGTFKPAPSWDSARQTKTMGRVYEKLASAMGTRARCMWCHDSDGTDIDHFRPKTDRRFYGYVFQWRNMILSCTPCGRQKGTQFPMAGNTPLLIDPTREDPWQHIEFDPVTGNMVARYDAAGVVDRKGEATVNTLMLHSRESVSEGCRRSYLRIERSVRQFLANPAGDAADLIQDLAVDDEHGLLGWVFHSTGQTLPPFNQLSAAHPAVWLQCANNFR